ncbi:MAG: hypothetical protein ACQETQ_07880 [Spirochaetota bacterium]
MERASAFIKRLLRDPALSELTPLQKEQQIVQFLHSNGSHVHSTLSHSKYFPDTPWSEIVALLEKALSYIVDDDLLPALRRIVYDQIDFSFVTFLGGSEAPRNRISDEVYQIITELLKRGPTRRALTGPYTAVYHRLAHPYIDGIYARETYIHFELTKVQRLRMGEKELKSMIDACLLLKPAIHLAHRENGQQRADRVVPARFAEEAVAELGSRWSLVPEQALRSAAHANVSFQNNRYVEATSRLVALFATRGRNYRPRLRSERGAEPPEKSWLSVARRNNSFYGFDVKMLDELYSIAAEKGW